MGRVSNLAKMAPRASVEQVYGALHGRIVRGELRPGDQLSETKVGEGFGLSRTPVREVFWRLGEDGLVRVVPQVGTFVAPISIPSVYDSQFVRETLECRAIPDAARLVTDADLAALETMLGRQEAALGAGDLAGFFALDEAMHRTLMEVAGRKFVWPVIAGAKAQLDRVRFLSLESGDWPEMIMSQHRALVAALAARDGRGAVRVMTAHLRTAFAAIERIAADHPAFFEGD
jgi:DNA-binding GntR family transcriptional regulator